jgi:hypothetical protein
MLFFLYCSGYGPSDRSSPMSKSARKTYTAYHEAGHAVIGRVLGLVCGSVTIVPDAVGFGCATTKSPQATLDVWDARGRCRLNGRDLTSVYRAYIMELMAGREAAELCCGPGGDFIGDGNDIQQIDTLIHLTYDLDLERWPSLPVGDFNLDRLRKAIFAAVAGCMIALLALYIRFHANDVAVVFHPLEQMFVYASGSEPQLAAGGSLLNAEHLKFLFEAVAGVIARRTFVLASSPRPTIFLEWFVIAATVIAIRRREWRLVLPDIPQMNSGTAWTIAYGGSPGSHSQAAQCSRRLRRPERRLIHRFGPFPRHSDTLLPS